MRLLRSNKLTVAIVFAHLAFMLLNGVPFIFGDGYGYFHIAKSLVTNGNFISQVTPDYYPYSAHGVTFDNGKYVTVYSPGSALIWLPALAITNVLNTGNSHTEYYQMFNGHSFADGFAVLLMAVICSIISLILIIKIIKQLGFSDNVAAIAGIATYLASFLAIYVFENPSYSHIYEVLCISLVTYLLLKATKAKKPIMYIILAGLVGGLALLVRPTTLLIVAPLACIIWNKAAIKKLAVYFAGFMPGIILFLIYNYASYGKPLTTGYSALWGQNFSFSEFNLFSILFSDIRGWFFYSPLMLVGLIGLAMFVRKSWQLAIALVIPVVATILLYAFWPNWWGGGSIGQRFFLCLIPFVAIGLAQVLATLQEQQLRIKRLAFTLGFILIAYSLSTTLLSRVTPVDSLGTQRTDYQQIPAAERFSPFDIYNYHLNLLRNAGSVKDYGQKFSQGLNGGRSLVMLAVGLTDPLVRIEQTGESKFIAYIVPNNKAKTQTVELTVGLVNNISQTIKITDIDTTKANQLEIECVTVCSAANSQQANITTLPVGNLQLGNIFFSTSSNFKLINPKLK